MKQIVINLSLSLSLFFFTKYWISWMTIFFLRTSACKILITRTIISRLDLNAKRIENTFFHIYFLRLIMGLKKKRRATSLKQSLRRISKAYRLFYPSYFLETSKSTCEQINFQSFLSKKKKTQRLILRILEILEAQLSPRSSRFWLNGNDNKQDRLREETKKKEERKN